MSQRLMGIGVSAGIAVGQVHLIHADRLPVVPVPIPPERVDEEINRFEEVRGTARAELRALRDGVLSALGDSYAGILDAQLLILDDPSLVQQTVTRIRAGRVSARWALKQVVAGFARKFEAIDDSYLRERVGDLSDVHRRLQRLLAGEPLRMPDFETGNLIVVSHNLVPSDAVALLDRGVAGLASDVGGPTSHTAILAQALSVPAVAGLQEISASIHEGDWIILDGTTGEVRIQPDEEEIAEARQRRQIWIDSEERAAAAAGEHPAVTLDGVHVALRANIEFAGEAEGAMRFGAEGIGLYRSEFLFLSRSPRIPTEEEHLETYRQLAAAVAPHPALIRTLDLGGEKYFHEVLERRESNPVLGLRGVRLCLERQDIFRPQLRGLLRAAAEAPLNLKVMLPLVTSAEEIRSVRALLAEETESLRLQGVAVPERLDLGIMIEVPGAAIAADLLAREADFFSIGTNDLIQYALAVDRSNEAVNYLYRPFHPGVLRMIKFVVESADRQGIPVSLCGEMAADPRATALLLGLGLRELSLQPRAMGVIRDTIRGLDTRECAAMARAALNQSTASEVRRSIMLTPDGEAH